MNKESEEEPMPQATLEQRMTALEETVRELQEAMHARQPSPAMKYCSTGGQIAPPI